MSSNMDLIQEKVQFLEKELILATDGSVKFKLEHEIAELKKQIANAPIQDSEKPVLPPETRVALINRTLQWDECIKKRMTKDEPNRKTFAFVIAGVWEEWPESFKYRVSKYLNISAPSCPIKFDVAANDIEELIISFEKDLLLQLDISITGIKSEGLETLLSVELAKCLEPKLFYTTLQDKIVKKPDYVQAIVEYWESLELTDSKKQHVLLIIYDLEEMGGFFSLGERKVEKWRKTLSESLSKNSKVVVPTLKSPTRKDVIEWISEELTDNLHRTMFEEAFAEIKDKSIPHLKLKHTYTKIAKKQS